MPFAFKARNVIDVFFPRHRLNPFQGLLDNKDKNPHSRVLRTTWFTKMADMFKVFYGDINPLSNLKVRFSHLFSSFIYAFWKIVGKNDDPINPTSLSSFFVTPIKARVKFNSKPERLKNKFGLFNLLALPIDGVLDLTFMITDYLTKAIFFIPNAIAELFFKLLKHRNPILKIIGGLFGAIFYAPFVLTKVAIHLVSLALYIGGSLVKAAASLALTLVAMPIVSIVNFIAYLKSHKLFDDFKTLNIMRAQKDNFNNTVYVSEPAAQSMKEILSALHREDYKCWLRTSKDFSSNQVDKNDESLLIYRENDIDESFKIEVAELQKNPAAMKALYKLNMFQVQNLNAESTFRELKLEFEDKKPESGTTPLLSE